MTRQQRWLLVASALVALVAVIAVAVGGGDDDGAADGTTTTTSAATDGAPSTDGGDGGTEDGDDGPDTDGTAPPGQTDSPTVDVEPLPPVGVGEGADFGGGLIATVKSVESVDLESQAPGETAGPGVLVRLEIRNDTGEAVDLGGVAINATYGTDATPAIPHQTGPIDVLSGTLEPGGTATGTYAFRLPEDAMGSLVIDVHHAGAETYVIVEVGGAVQ